MRESEEWTVRVDSGEYSPILGDSFDNIARRGLSLQRSQTSGRFTPTIGPSYSYYAEEPKGSSLHNPASTFYDGLPKTFERTIGTAAQPIDEAVESAVKAFTVADPSASAPALAQGLKLTREAIAAATDPDITHVLKIKEQQFQDAINACVGATLIAVTNPPVMSAPVAGQTFNVDARLEIRGKLALTPSAPVLTGARGWKVEGYRVTVGDDAAISTKPYFSRKGLQESRYTLSDAAQFGRPDSPVPLIAIASYAVDGVPVEIRESVKRREAKLPYGEVLREVRSVPRLAVSVSPAHAILATGQLANRPTDQQELPLEVTILHNADNATSGRVDLRLPAGWKSEPASQPFSFSRAGERASYSFAVTPSAIEAKPYTIEAVATAAGKEYREGYELIDHRDLEVRYLYRASTAEVRGVNVTTVAGLRVGYVMGIGDQVPMGLQQLGAQVTLLDERALASADLSVYDSIMTGTRAYAVREDLKTYNSRLLDYVKAGGNMIVLYNTQELVPNTFAPFPGELPRTAEEVSEENSPVTILAPAHQAFNWPNKITTADFDGWVEQRGSKFFTKWDAAYTPMISTFDRNQPPQSGGWLTAKVGKGNWTYFAYSLTQAIALRRAGSVSDRGQFTGTRQEP